MAVVADAKAVSPTQLQVTLSKPSNDWLFRMTTRIGAMMDPKGVDALATKPVGTGPYLFDTWNRGDSITLKANPAYWGSKPAYSTVVMKYFKDATALNNALLTGTINVIVDVVGYYRAPAGTSYVPRATPARILDTRSTLGGHSGAGKRGAVA